MKPRISLEGMIVASTAGLFVIVGFFLLLGIYQNAARAAELAFDRVLEAAALSIADTVGYDNGKVTVDIPYSAFAILGTSRLNRIFYRVVAPDGAVVTGSPVLGLQMVPATGPALRLADGLMQGEPVRIAAVGRYRSDALTGQAGWFDVFVAETMEARTQLSNQLTISAALPAAAIALCAFGLIWIGIRMIFSPLRSIERSLRLRSPSDLSAIEGRLPREIATLVIALNQFMARLSSTLDGLRRVTADAAHQLRTPLAALRAQAEIALEEDDPDQMRKRLVRIHENAVDASVLANRWLTDATLLHSIKAARTERLDLVEQVRRAIDRLAAESRFGDQIGLLKMETPGIPVFVQADPVSLVEMIRNVLENTFLYAPGHNRLLIDVEGDKAIIRVVDQGPGIPPERREAVFKRFERNSNFTPGTGLGLAIARDVVEGAGGTISLSDNLPKGLCVTIALPLALPHSTEPAMGAKQQGRLSGVALIAILFCVPFAGLPIPVRAQNIPLPFGITSSIAPERMAPILNALEPQFPGVTFSYSQARSPQIAATLTAHARHNIDLVIMPTPDIAVAITNAGLATRAPGGLGAPDTATRHWREELFVLAYDPAVIAFRPDGFTQTAFPRSRLELAQALENTASLFKRVGIVNVGIDSVSYALASQDSLRTPLFWRLARAFGAAQARIYDNSAELLEALAVGEIDLAYNVPLSEIMALPPDASIDFVEPQDYVLALPWVAFVPKESDAIQNTNVLATLLSEPGIKSVAQAIWGTKAATITREGHQRIELGPELLVFLDSIKRSRFLDYWFELVTAP